MLRGELENPELFHEYKHGRIEPQNLIVGSGEEEMQPTRLQAVIKTYRDGESVVLAEEAWLGYVEPETSYDHAVRNLFIASLALKSDDLYSNLGPNIHINDGFFTPYIGSQLHIFGQYSIAIGYLLSQDAFSDHKPELRVGFDRILMEDLPENENLNGVDVILRQKGRVSISIWPQYGIKYRNET